MYREKRLNIRTMNKTIFVVLTIVFCSCAALFKGPSESVEFTSQPSGANVYVNGVLKGKAPLQLRLETKKNI